MAKKKTKRPVHIRHWTKDELKILRSRVKPGGNSKEIASIVDRTAGAVRQKAFALGLRFRPAKKKKSKKKT